MSINMETTLSQLTNVGLDLLHVLFRRLPHFALGAPLRVRRGEVAPQVQEPALDRVQDPPEIGVIGLHRARPDEGVELVDDPDGLHALVILGDAIAAEEIGLKGSHFVNSTGLPDENHHMTAWDIAHLASLVIERHPEYYKWYSQKEYTFNDITQYNRNKLLWRDDSVDGVKTGHTDSAGYCLVTSAQKEGMRLITVVLGTGSANARADASQSLLNYGFRFFETHKLYEAGASLATSRIWKGSSNSVSLGLDRILYVTIPRGQYEALDASMKIDNRIMAPVSAGTQLGSVQVRLGEDIVAEQPLVSLQEVDEGSFWQRITDEALLYFE